MSLSPQSYQESIGIARVKGGSCLVFLVGIVGETPGGCDGWVLIEHDGAIYSNNFTAQPHCTVNGLFPPYGAPAERLLQSKQLFEEVRKIRHNYWAVKVVDPDGPDVHV